MRTAASLKLKVIGSDRTILRIINLTGHILPTGDPEGRRMWVNVRYLDDQSAVIDEIGMYGPTADTQSRREITAHTLLDPIRRRVYTIRPFPLNRP